MASKTEICNMALSHLGIGKEVSDIETESSEEAHACNRMYDVALETTLRDFNWPFANRVETLALVEEDPNSEWSYSYRYPVGCVKIKKILSGIRNDTRQSRVPYEFANDDSGQLIYTDQEDAEIKFTYLVDSPEFYPADFVMALSFRIAFLVAPRIAGGDPFKTGDRALALYRETIRVAQASAMEEEQSEEDVDSEFIRERS